MHITRGRVLAQRFFDLADEVDLPAAEEALREKLRRPRVLHRAPHLQVTRPPLEVLFEPRPSGVPDTPPVNALCRLYDVGVLAVTFDIPTPAPLEPEAVVRFARRVLEAEEAVSEAGRGLAVDVLAAIRPACKRPELSRIVEDYTIFIVQETEPEVDAVGLRRELDVARTLLGETGELSDDERRQVTELSFSYSPSELVVITWNSALVLGQETSLDVADLLEVTGMQLLEMRAYDDLVGRSLDRLYDELDHEPLFVPSNKYRRLSRQIMRLLVDITEVTERVENSLQWLGDTWLARIHRAAVRASDIPRWQRQLEHKLDLLRRIDQLIIDQITTRQSMRLEVAIVILILVEVVLAIFGGI